MSKKSFFEERTVSQISDLKIKQIYSQKGLVEKVANLADDEAIELRSVITNLVLFSGYKGSSNKAQKCMRHGNYLPLNSFQNLKQTELGSHIPLEARTNLFNQINLPEEEIQFMGIEHYPICSAIRDKRLRRIPFVFCVKGGMLFKYAETCTSGIKITPYANAKMAERDGAIILCDVPSSAKKKERYKIKLLHVPLHLTDRGKKTIWSLKTENIGKVPEFKHYAEIGYAKESSKEPLDFILFDDHDIAAYLAVIRKYWKEHNLAPITFNPFPLPSRKLAEFYKKWRNNVVIYDNSLDSNRKLRKPLISEDSIMCCRHGKVYGFDESLYWDQERDGKLTDYDW